MKRLLACLFLVIGLGLIFSESTFAKEKVYFCSLMKAHKVPVITSTPCSKTHAGNEYKKISAKEYIIHVIDIYGQGDDVIQSLYDDFKSHNLDTNIIRKITKGKKRKKKITKEKDFGGLKMLDKKQEGIEAVIALCSNEKNLNKVTLSYFKNLSEYKKNASFKNGDCNYVVDRYVNAHLFKFLLDKSNKDKYVVEKKYIDELLDWTKEIFYVTPEGKFIEVVSLVLLNEPIQTQEVVEKSDKKKKKWTGKPFSRKKLVSFILNNVITIDYEGKKESYIFKKVEIGCQYTVDRGGCWKFIYEVQEGIKIVGKGTWMFHKMAQHMKRDKKTDNQGRKFPEEDLSKFANLNKKLSKNSIKLSGYRSMYLQVYKKQDRVSTYAWVPRKYEDPKKDKKDDQINREIVNITPTKDFEKRIETIRLVKLESIEGKKIAEEKRIADAKKAEEKRIAEEKRLVEEKRIAEEERKKQEKILAEKKKEEEKRKKELLLAQKEVEDEKKKQKLLLAQKKAEEERKKQELLLAQKKAEEEKKKKELLLAQKKAEEEKRLAEEKKIADAKKAEEKKKVAKKPKKEFKPEEKEIDNDPPVILIAKTITVNDTSYEIKGKITDQSEKVFIEIDGRPVRVKGGKFKVQRFSPVDEQITIVAIDQWGNRSEPKFVNIKIDIKDTAVVEKLEPLDPSNMRSKSNKNRVALIIGIEKYEQAPAASFANLDATYFYEYARKGFGVSKSNMKLLVDEDANLIKSLGIISKWLPGKIVKNQTELIIFFAGHGLASTDGKELYFLTQDSDPDLLTRTALSRTELFKEIISLEPKSVTMFMDTCYSGVSRDEEILLASARPIRIVADEQEGVPDNFTIFTASQLDQISSGLKEANHGIFSYYLMKGLEGKADRNKDKQITNGEMLAYMDQNVSQKASELGRQQNPSLAGDHDQVLISYR